MSDNKKVVEIRIYRNTLINRYSAELIFTEWPNERRVRRSCGGLVPKDLVHCLANFLGGMEIHLEDAEKGGDNT